MTTSNTAEQKSVIGKKELRSIFLRSLSLEYSWNYERQQNMGYCFAMLPAIKKIYQKKEDQIAAAKRHMEFFNTTPYISTAVFGISTAMEESNARNEDFDTSSINNVKVALMGPLAGIGDSMFWGTLRVIATGIGTSLAMQGSILGPLLFWLIFNVPAFAVRYICLKFGYKFGTSFLNKIEESGMMPKLTFGAAVLGLMVIGAMIPSMITVNIAGAIGSGDAAVKVQEILDGIMPNLVPFAMTLGIYGLLQKKVKVSWILIVLMIVGIVGALLGILKFDENQILKNGEYIYAQRAEIEKIADAVCEKGFDNILFTSSGGSLAMMQPFDYMISVMSNLNVQSQISAELLVEGNNHLTDKTLVFMASKSGDTKETVAAAKYVKEKGATIVSVLGVDNSPMGELSDYSVVYKDGRPQEYVLYMLIGKLLENKGFFDDYKQFADELKNLPAALVSVGKASEPKARAYAEKYKDDPYQIWIGSGNLWGPTYSFAMCVLEESQWLRTKSVTSPEFFHGTIELVEKGVCVALNMTEGQTRKLDQRVKDFVGQYTDDFTVFDTADYELPGISDKFRWMLSPVVINAVLSRVSKNFEQIRDHSLDIRRYYRKVEY